MKTLIRGGLVVDPANKTERITNVLFENGRVADVTDLVPDADMIFDAAGMTVTPGFIDIHMHEDRYFPKEDRFEEAIAPCMLRMGVTTMLGGNCGSNRYDPGVYLDAADRLGTASNIALLAGHSTLRALSCSRGKYEAATADEIRKMQYAAEKWLALGCAGISYGIRYVPGSTEEELCATAKACAAAGKMAAAHIRDDAAFVFDAAEEFLRITTAAGCRAEVSHIGSMAGFGQMRDFLTLLEKKRREGIPVYADCYPYAAFSTEIGETTYDDGFLERYGTDYSAIEICEGPYKGMRCTEEIFRELRKSFPDTLTVCRVMKPEDIELALLDPEVTIGSDGILSGMQGHPRAAGSFPKYLREYVQSGKLPLSEGIAKLTSLPAERIGLKDRGSFTRGNAADAVVFDPASVRDCATFDNPVLPPEGIRAVFVNGILACENGTVLTTHAGKAVRI